MAKLWQKEYSLNELMENFTVGRDYLLDQKLVMADCLASTAHGMMLNRIGILNGEEISALKDGFREIIRLKKEDNFPITREDEDCHTAIENFLTRHAGDAGKKIHTGRSRNDQVITALRLYSRDFLMIFSEVLLSLISSLVSFAEKNRNVPMPGRTHMQIAMPSSVGLWGGAFAEEFADTLDMILKVLDLVDQNPLGSAASYGVPLPLDREYTGELLGFSRVQNNVLYVNNSRGKFESYILDQLDQSLLTSSKMAQDLILFSLPEFGYFSLPVELCSGSSIMPQKKNPDGLELVRAKASSLSAYSTQVKNIIRSLPTGYNRDFQETKEPFLRGCDLAMESVEIMKLTTDKLEVNRSNLERGFLPGIFATDDALDMVAKGSSFRDAYRSVGMNLSRVGKRDPARGITSRTSTGTAGNLSLNKLRERMDDMARRIGRRREKVDAALSNLLGEEVPVYKKSSLKK